MDTWTAASGQASAEYLEQARINRIESGLRTIKQCMPEVYALIKSRAEEVGSAVYALVRRGLGGEPGCFYAFEAGHVVGTPLGFDPKRSGLQGAAEFLVLYGCAHVCIWPDHAWPKVQAGGADGAD